MARPKKELTQADKFYLDSHINNIPTELAEAIGTTEDIVTSYVEQKKSGQMPINDTIINKTRNGRERGVAVMTQAASEIGDEVRKSSIGKKRNDPSMIHQCGPKK